LDDEELSPEHAVIEDFHCVQDGASLTGKVLSGWVRLRAPILECKRSIGDLSLSGEQVFGQFWSELDPSSEDYSFSGIFSSDLRRPREGEVSMVRMLSDDVSSYCIVVRCIDSSKKAYERIGYAEWNHYPDDDGWEYKPFEVPWPEEQTAITIT
jgi:hypothetical protein